MKKLLLIGCLSMLAGFARAQEQLSIKEQAYKLFERYEYFKCLPLYLKLDKGAKTNVKILERIADCYRNLNQYDSTEVYYDRATADAKASKISHYNYAEVLLRNKKLDKAKEQYRLYFTDDAAALQFKLATCDSAAAGMANATGYKIKNEAGLNTPYSDWGLIDDGKSSLLFTSDRPTGNDDTDDRTGNNWFKLYGAALNGDELKQITLGGDSDTFNNDYHVGPIALNKTADTAYITIATGLSKKQIVVDQRQNKNAQKLYTRRLLLVTAARKDGQWNIYGSFAYNNIQEYSVSDAALSKDGKLLYFVSDMPGGEGKTDLWYCEKLPNGSWGSPINCGKAINTKEEEAYPIIGGDGTLYFASKGLPGMGGYDIYKASGEKAQWSAPKNLRYPINTTSDDFYFVTRDGLKGYLSSNREGGQGSDDIYSFTFNPADSVPVKQIVKVVPVKPPAVIVPNAGTPTVKPQPPAIQQPIVLNTIYYDLDKANIRPDAAAELDKLATVMQQHPLLKIELSSFTDSRASEKYNEVLSERRAASVVAYLAGKGIDKNRLVAHYYGETRLVTNCPDGVPCTEPEHQLNRRTEFRMIEGN